MDQLFKVESSELEQRLINECLKEDDVEECYYVTFIGKSNMKNNDMVWETDNKLCEELKNINSFINYYYTKVYNDWFNVVLFKNLDFIKEFEKSETHRYACYELSPNSFDKICIKRGKKNGKMFDCEKCVLIDYSKKDFRKEFSRL